jgi:hypothetical protein
MKSHVYEHAVHDEKDALLYLINCQLATLTDMAMRKSRPKYEYKRQIDIAQNLVNWIQEFHIEVDEGNRVQGVLDTPSKTVEEWVKRFEK